MVGGFDTFDITSKAKSCWLVGSDIRHVGFGWNLGLQAKAPVAAVDEQSAESGALKVGRRPHGGSQYSRRFS